MFDLIGFWGSVTFIVFPAVFVCWLILESIINMEVKAISKGWSSFRPAKDALNKFLRNSSDELGILVGISSSVWAIVTIILLAIAAAGGFVHCDTGVGMTLLEAVSHMAMGMAGFMTYVTTPVIIYIVYRLTVRKALVAMVEMKEKLDKL